MGYEEIRKAGQGKRLKFLVKDTALYGIASALSRFLSILTVPVLTRVFSKTEFGAIDAISIFSSLVIPLIFLGMDTAVARFYFESEDEEEKKAIVTQPFIVGIITSTLFAALLYINAASICEIYLNSTDYVYEFQIMSLGLPFIYITAFTMGLLKWTFARVHFLIISIGNAALIILLTLLFVVGFKYGIVYIFYAVLIGKAIFGFLGLYFCRDHFGIISDFRYLRPLLKFGIPFTLVSFFGVLIPSMDRYFISNYLSIESLGGYALALKVTSLLLILDRGLQTAWGPFAYSIYKEKDSAETFNKVLLLVSLFLAFCLITITTFEYPLILILGSEKYLDSHVLIPFLACAVIARSMSGITAIGIDLAKKTGYYILTYGIGVIVTFVLMYILVNYLGLIGVALGFMVGRFTVLLIQTIISNHLYPIRFQFVTPFLILLFGFFLSLFVDYCFRFGLIIQIGVGCMVFIIFGFLIYKLVVNESEKMIVKKWLFRFSPLSNA